VDGAPPEMIRGCGSSSSSHVVVVVAVVVVDVLASLVTEIAVLQRPRHGRRELHLVGLVSVVIAETDASASAGSSRGGSENERGVVGCGGALVVVVVLVFFLILLALLILLLILLSLCGCKSIVRGGSRFVFSLLLFLLLLQLCIEQLWDQVSGGEHNSCRGQDVHSMQFFLYGSSLGVGERERQRRWLLAFFLAFVELLPLGFSVTVSVVHQRQAVSENRNVPVKK